MSRRKRCKQDGNQMSCLYILDTLFCQWLPIRFCAEWPTSTSHATLQVAQAEAECTVPVPLAAMQQHLEKAGCCPAWCCWQGTMIIIHSWAEGFYESNCIITFWVRLVHWKSFTVGSGIHCSTLPSSQLGRPDDTSDWELIQSDTHWQWQLGQNRTVTVWPELSSGMRNRASHDCLRLSPGYKPMGRKLRY